MKPYSLLHILVAGALCATALTVRINAQTAAGTGQIKGSVVSASDKSNLSGVTVNIFRIGSPQPFSAKVVRAGDGTFTASGLATGTYGMCANQPGGMFIDQCEWSDFHSSTLVTTGKITAGAVIHLKKASGLTIRVNDAGTSLARGANEHDPPHVLVGVFDSRGILHPAIETKRDGTGVSYLLPIPVDFPVRLTVASDKVDLEDDRHVAVPAKGVTKVVFQPVNQAQAQSFTFNATGRKP